MTAKDFLQTGVIALALAVALMGGRRLEAQPTQFVRGDVNDDGGVNLSDAVKIFRYLFLGDTTAERCLDAADVNNDGTIQIDDGIYLLQYLFQRGRPPHRPFPSCYIDGGVDDLSCEQFDSCDPIFRNCDRPFDGDTVIFVIDQTASMTDNGELELAKEVVVAAISEFTEDMAFGIIFFDHDRARYPLEGPPVRATTAAKEAAIQFINSAGEGGPGCTSPALMEGLELANLGVGQRKILCHVGDGGGTCMGGNESTYLQTMLSDVTAANQARIVINCVGIKMSGRTMQAMYMEQLAEANGGKYCAIP